jgi:hypothetical protein
VKLIDGIKNVGRPFYISECGRDKLPEFFKEMGYKIGAEIGVYKGEFTEKFCKVGLRMYAIDPWLGYSGSGRSEEKQDKQDLQYNETVKRLEPYDCMVFRLTSMEAVNYFKDNFFDFVYIDGNHAFPYIAEDVYEWTKKVRPGGIVSGHDYWVSSPSATNVVSHVKPIIDAYTSTFDIDFYVFGAIGGTKYDSVLSWMFFKK